MTFGILWALASAVAYGTSDFVGGVGARRCSPWRILLVGQVAGTVALLVAGLLAGGAARPADVLWGVLGGAGSAVGGFFLLRGLARGRMGLAAPVSAVGAATLPVLVGAALGEAQSVLAWVGILVALPGIWLVARAGRVEAAGRSAGALVDGIVAGIGFGLLFVCVGQVRADAGLLPLAAGQATGAALIAAAALALRASLRGAGAIGWGSASGLLGAAGTVAFALSNGATTLAVAAVLTSLYPAVTVLLALGVLRERISPSQGAGLGVCTLAIIALSLG